MSLIRGTACTCGPIKMGEPHLRTDCPHYMGVPAKVITIETCPCRGSHSKEEKHFVIDCPWLGISFGEENKPVTMEERKAQVAPYLIVDEQTKMSIDSSKDAPDPVFKTLDKLMEWRTLQRHIIQTVSRDKTPLRDYLLEHAVTMLHRVTNTHEHLFPDLKHCPNPWCHEKEDLLHRGYRHIQEFILCGSCGMVGPESNSKVEAIINWNTRPNEDALLKAVEPFVHQQRGFFLTGNCGPDSPKDWPDNTHLMINNGAGSYPIGQPSMTVKQWRELATQFENAKNPPQEE